MILLDVAALLGLPGGRGCRSTNSRVSPEMPGGPLLAACEKSGFEPPRTVCCSAVPPSHCRAREVAAAAAATAASSGASKS